jgi:asparagine synthase (glutamine-hydrolysing)
MTAFAGIVAFDGAADNFLTPQQLASAVGAQQRAQLEVRRLGDALFVQRLPTGTEHTSARGEAGGRLLFAADARLDNRAELAHALAIPLPELARTADGTLILRAWQHWGAVGVARCLGAFAFAGWDADARHLILGRDCRGNRALFFYRGRDFVVFATTLRALLALPGVPREIDEITLANFLALNLAEPRRTFYRGIERIPSRTLVTIGRADMRHRHYWSPDLEAPPPYQRDEDYVERARELLDQAVAAAISDTPHVAISASGGLDSTAIAATAARLGQVEKITCYTLIAPPGSQIDVGRGRYLDERDKIEALVRMHPALEARFFAAETPHPFREDDSRLFARDAAPVLGPANLGAFAYIYDAVAAAGHRAMLVGAAGNFGLTWGGDFSLLALIRAGQWRTFAADLLAAGRTDGRGLLRAFAGDVVTPAAPAPLRRLLHRLRGRDPDSVARFSPLNPAFVAQAGLARCWRTSGFDPWFGYDGRNAVGHRAYFLFDRNQFARDFFGMSNETRGFETRDPLGDRRLLEFVLSVPEPIFRRRGVPRSFARAVLADRLPREILDERRRGAQGVTWFQHLEALRPAIAVELERLNASPSARRLIDLPRLKMLLDQWPKDQNEVLNRRREYRLVLNRGVHVGRFIRWVEGGNA